MPQIVVANEFAVVSIRLVRSSEPGRIRIRDERTKRSIDLDALELEAIAWARRTDLEALVDPSRNRWSDEMLRDATDE